MPRTGFSERYEISDQVCHVIGYAATWREACGLAGLYATGGHRNCGDVLIYDRMAHCDKPELWSHDGSIRRVKGGTCNDRAHNGSRV